MASAGVTRSMGSYPAMDGNGGECCRAGPRAALRPMLINERNGVGFQHSQIPVDAADQTSKLRTVGRTDVETAYNRRSRLRNFVQSAEQASKLRTIGRAGAETAHDRPRRRQNCAHSLISRTGAV